MTDLRDFVQQPPLQALAWALIHFLWQGALLGLAAFLALRVARPGRAATRHAIGVATLAAMLATCVGTFTFLLQQPVATAEPAAAEAASPVTPAPSMTTVAKFIDARGSAAKEPFLRLSGVPRHEWDMEPFGPAALLAIVTGWAIGVLALSFRLVGGWALARRLVRHAVSGVSPALDDMAREVACRLQLKRAVRILESRAVTVPTLVGWLTPVVLFPAAALAGLSPDQLRAILAHELAHVRRHDYLINLLQSIVETLLFYHPAMWWVSAQVRAEREHCCDDLALDVCRDRIVYVSALAELTSMAGDRRLMLAATDGSLVDRVHRILGRQRSRREPAPAWALLAMLVLVAGSVASFGAQSATPPIPPVTATTLPIGPVDQQEAEATAALDAELAKRAQRAQREEKELRAALARQIELMERALRAKQARAEDAERAAREAEQRDALAELVRLQAVILREQSDRTRAESDRLREVEAALRAEAAEAREQLPPPPPPPPPAPRASQTVPAPPAPPEPPEPPEPPQETGTRGSGNMTWSDNGQKIAINWTGAFRLSDDEKDIAWVQDGATVTISDGVILTSRIELRGASGRVERTYWRNGSKQDFEPEGRKLLAESLDLLIRRSALFAKDRVARFLKQGGPDAVLKEIDRLGDSSYVRRVYYTELLKQATVTDALLTRVVERIPNDVKSNYDKSTVLTQAAALPAITDTHRATIARGAKSIASNYDRRRTLMAVLVTTPVAPAVAAAVIDSASGIDSNHDRSMVLVELASRGGVTSATSAAFMAQVRSMSSSYDQRRVLSALAAQGPLPSNIAAEAVTAAGAMTSSHDHSNTLITMIESGGLTDATAQEFFSSAARISSSHDLGRVLTAAINQPNASDRIVEGVLRTAPRMSSSHDRANVLVAVAGRARIQGTARELYLTATKGLGTHDENRALAALVKAETRR